MTGRRPRLRAPALALALLVAAALAGCSGDPESSDGPGAVDSSTSPATTPTPAAKPPPAPEDGACYRLSYEQAVSPTSGRGDTPCAQAHTTETYAVGELTTVADGHLFAVDSQRVQDEVATTCPDQVSDYVGGDENAWRLSMLQAVWFTPTLAQSDRGASWYRCDVVALSGSEQLAEVTGSLEGVLASPESRAPYAMCGTAAPDDPGFERVPCSADHSWRAVSVVTYISSVYPGDEAAEARGQTPCQDAGAAAADDPLDYQWGFEFPTEEQWDAGMDFGRCWVPDGA